MTGVGKARRDRLLTAAGARAGDALVLTKAAGLEGSHILANDFQAELVGRVAEALLEEARGYATELSVVPEARLARRPGRDGDARPDRRRHRRRGLGDGRSVGVRLHD